MLESRPGSTPQQINAALEGSAIDMNAAGFDHDSGYGLIQADAAIAALLAAGGNNAPPVASFTYTCSARTCSFDSSASTDDAGIVSYFWEFGDGGDSSSANPMHTYPANGNFGVTLVVTDAEGASDIAIAIFRVKNKGNSSGSSDGGDGGDGGTGGKEKGRMKCSDGIDNDGDGLIDAADPDC